MAKLYVGTSGYYYDHWIGRFYPKHLKRDEWLEFYAARFQTAELNTTFYHLPKAKTVEGWLRRTPATFIYAVKVHRSVTHLRKLHNAENELFRFLHIIKPLKTENRLGVVLHQTPPSLQFDKEQLEEYLEILPHDYRHCLEFRHESWFNEEVFELLQQRGIGICIIGMEGLQPQIRATAPFVYFRLHGPVGSLCYSDEDLTFWAEKIFSFYHEGTDVFVYFNNDYDGYAAFNALSLMEILHKRFGVTPNNIVP